MEMVKGAFDNWRAFTQSSEDGAFADANHC